MKLFLCCIRFPMSDYLDKSLINTQPILLTIDNTKQILHFFSSTNVDTIVSIVVANIPWKYDTIFSILLLFMDVQMSIFGISQISVTMALMPYSLDLGYIIMISFREKVQRLKLAGYCSWTMLLKYMFVNPYGHEFVSKRQYMAMRVSNA